MVNLIGGGTSSGNTKTKLAVGGIVTALGVALAYKVAEDMGASAPSDDTGAVGIETMVFGENQFNESGKIVTHEKLYNIEKTGPTAEKAVVFEPVFDNDNMTKMAPTYNGTSLTDKLTADGKTIADWNISYELDNGSHAMIITAQSKVGNISYKSDPIPFEELRGEGKLAKIKNVKEVRILPRNLLDDKEFTLKVKKNIMTQELYNNTNVIDETNGTYERAEIAMPDDWMDEKLVAKVTYLEKPDNATANRTGKLNLTGAAEFFDQMDNGKIDGSADEFIKDFNAMAYGSHQSVLAQEYKQLALNTMKTLNETRNLLDEMKNNYNATNTSYEAKLADLRGQLSRMTTNYTDMWSKLNISADLATDLKGLWNGFNTTLEQFNKTYTRTTEGDKHTAGRTFYNALTAQERDEMLTALGIDKAAWDKLFDDNATDPSPEMRKIEVTIPGLGEKGQINITTSAGNMIGSVDRAYAVGLEQKILGSKEGMIDYTGAGEMPAYLAKLSGAALKAEIDKLKGTEGCWGVELKYDDKNNSKFASLANIIDGLYGQVGGDWNSGNYSLGFLDTQDKDGMGGIVYVQNGTEMKAYTLTKDNIKKAKEIVG